MIINNLILLIVLVTLSECHDYQRHQNHHYHHNPVKGRTGHNIKSYGGYFPDTAGYNEAANDYVHSQNYHQPQNSYQPYGWNFNQPRRTYGGVNVLSHQSNDNPQYPQNHIGWANNNLNSYSGVNNPFFPPFPQPNFYNFPQFPFPTFPNMFPYAGGYPQSNQNYPSGGNTYPQQRPVIGNNVNNQGSGQLPYPSNNANPGFPTVPPRQPTYPQNNFNQGIPTGRPTNQGQLPYPNVNQGVPNVDRNINSGGHTPQINNNQGTPTIQPQQPYPQNNVNQVTPTIQPQQPNPQNNVNQGTPTIQPQQPYPQNNVNQGIPTGGLNQNTERPTSGTASIGRFPTDNRNNLNTGETDFQRPITQNLPQPNQDDSTGIDIRYTGKRPDNRFSESDSTPNKNKDFASNSFFGINDNREWTEDDELKWQATTKAPYFENKVPGLECTLPAAAVLGAQNAFKASALLPLNIPPGKPILSCNATDLLQSQIRLDGKIYDCDKSEVTISCPSHGGTVDECEGQILKCDVDNFNALPIWCTNGTIVSNSHVVCESASIMPSKSTLNCFFKTPVQPGIRQNIPRTTTIAPNFSILPVVPLPPRVDNKSNSTNINEDNVYPEYFEFEEESEEVKDLKPQVMKAMKNVFPHDLLTMPSTQYLPPKASIQPIDSNLKNHINGVFNVDLLASSQNANSITTGDEKSVPTITLDRSDVFPARPNTQSDLSTGNWREQENSNRNYNANRHSGIKDGSKTNTESRFGGENRPQFNMHDRLIFTS